MLNLAPSRPKAPPPKEPAPLTKAPAKKRRRSAAAPACGAASAASYREPETETAQVLKPAPPQPKAPPKRKPAPLTKAPAVGELSGEQVEPRSSAEKHEGVLDRGEALIGEP